MVRAIRLEGRGVCAGRSRKICEWRCRHSIALFGKLMLVTFAQRRTNRLKKFGASRTLSWNAREQHEARQRASATRSCARSSTAAGPCGFHIVAEGDEGE